MTDVTDLRETAGAVSIERDVVEVDGSDAASWLHGQLSQSVETMTVGTSAPSFLLQPTGRVDAWLRITRLGDDTFWLDVDGGWGDAVRARLERFKLRANADLAVLDCRVVALRGPGSLTVPAPVTNRVRVLPAGWPGVEGVDLVGPAAEIDQWSDTVGAEAAPAEALEALRIECGVPAMGTELTDRTIPGEAGQWVVDASVDFAKGCFTGQELVARVDSRGGNVPRPVRGLVADAPMLAGAAVTHDGREVGHITSSARSAVLGQVALAPLTRSVEPGAQVAVDGVPAEVRTLPLR